MNSLPWNSVWLGSSEDAVIECYRLEMKMLIMDADKAAQKHHNHMHRPINEVHEYVCDDDDCSCCAGIFKIPHATNVSFYKPVVKKVRDSYKRLLYNEKNRKLHSRLRLEEVVSDIEALRSGNYKLVDAPKNVYTGLSE